MLNRAINAFEVKRQLRPKNVNPTCPLFISAHLDFGSDVDEILPGGCSVKKIQLASYFLNFLRI